jgi:DDE family transposase
MRTLAMPKTAEPWSLTSLREKLIKIGAKVVNHGRYVTFQMAEVAVPRQMFHEILSMIARLRAPPTRQYHSTALSSLRIKDDERNTTGNRNTNIISNNFIGGNLVCTNNTPPPPTLGFRTPWPEMGLQSALDYELPALQRDIG